MCTQNSCKVSSAGEGRRVRMPTVLVTSGMGVVLLVAPPTGLQFIVQCNVQDFSIIICITSSLESLFYYQEDLKMCLRLSNKRHCLSLLSILGFLQSLLAVPITILSFIVLALSTLGVALSPFWCGLVVSVFDCASGQRCLNNCVSM